MLADWAAALVESQARDDVRVIVLTGAGNDFCAGGDLKEMKARVAESPLSRKNSLATRIHKIPLTLLTIDKPVLAAVNGAATGAGMDMALMCDIRIAAADTRFAESYVSVGLVPGAGGSWFLPKIVGMSKALELLWTGRFVDANEALAMGLVNEVVPAADLLSHTHAFASRLASGPSMSIRLTKRAARQAAGMELSAHLDLISSHLALVVGTDDHREALEAIEAKRRPVFKGR